MEMEALQIKYFMAVARSESISKAAQEFMVPPSSVSVAIKKLEADWGYPLFERTANRLMLNANGKLLYKALEKAQAAIETARTETQNLSGVVTGELRLLVLNNRSRVTECISRFKTEYPKIMFNIRHDGKLNFKDYDVIITDKVIETTAYTRQLFCREEIFLAVPKHHTLAGKKRISVSMLAGEKFICMPRESNLGEYAHNAFVRAGILPEIAIECDDPQYILSYLKLGLGICFFPSLSWKKQADEQICLLSIEDGMQRESYLYVRKNAAQAVHLFAQALLETRS